MLWLIGVHNTYYGSESDHFNLEQVRLWMNKCKTFFVVTSII